VKINYVPEKGIRGLFTCSSRKNRKAKGGEVKKGKEKNGGEEKNKLKRRGVLPYEHEGLTRSRGTTGWKRRGANSTVKRSTSWC